MNNFSYLLTLPLIIGLILFHKPGVSFGENEDRRVQPEKNEDLENALIRSIGENFQNGFLDLRKVIDSITKILVEQRAEIINMKQNNKLLRKINKLKLSLSLEEFNELVQRKNNEIIVGKSFNGSTLAQIKSHISRVGYRGVHTAIVFVNYLNETINDFTIHDPSNAAYTPAPNSIPPNTQEVFTLAEVSNYYGVTSFSYAIPSQNIRIAAISRSGTYGSGLAFVPTETDMTTYFNSKMGIPGSSIWECCEYVDRYLSVGYKNFYARMFADNEGAEEATFRIELVKLSLDD